MKDTKESSMAELYNQTLKDIQEGQIVTGKIVAITDREALIDVGYKSEGIIPLQEFLQPKDLKIDQQIDVFVETKEDDDGRIILSREKAIRLKGWNKIIECVKEGDLVDGKVLRKVRGGFIVEVFGTEGFLPLSLSASRNMSDQEILNNTFKFQVAKMKFHKTLILSRKDALYKIRGEAREKFWSSLKAGEIRQGVVKGITDFGAFIDLGGADGLLHITDMSWFRISHPSEIVAIGDKIDVVILKFDKDAQKIYLGLKQKTPDPWIEIENKYPAGSKIKGKLVNIVSYGVFVELEKGIEGLVHSSEISWQKRMINPQEHFAIGDIVEVKILNIDKEAKRISLSIKQLEVNPWLEAKNKFPEGSKITGRVRGFTDYGTFVELDANLEGMIHISDMSWTKKISHPQDILRKGQKIEVQILNVDAENKKIALGLKQLIPDPWPSIAERYPIDLVLDVEVLQISNFGVFVKLEDDLDGLVYSSEIEKEQLEKIKVGDKLKVKVIKVDLDQKKIGLSAKL